MGSSQTYVNGLENHMVVVSQINVSKSKDITENSVMDLSGLLHHQNKNKSIRKWSFNLKKTLIQNSFRRYKRNVACLKKKKKQDCESG